MTTAEEAASREGPVPPASKAGAMATALGIIGCGLAGLRHRDAIRRVGGARIAAVADPAGEARRPFRQPGTVEYEDPMDLLRDPAVEVVVVCSPTRFHADQALAALDHGKHLLLEKPVCLEVAEAERVLRRARESPRTVTTGHNLRYHRTLQRALEALRSGVVGQLLSIQTHTSSYSGLRGRRPGSTGCGTFLEMAIHHFDLWRWLGGREVASLSAWSRGDDVVAAAGRLEDGTLVSTTASQVAPPLNFVDLLGTEGRIRACLYRCDGLEVVRGDVTPADPGYRLRRAVETVRSLPRWLEARRRGGEYLAVFDRQWQDLLHCLRHGTRPRALLEDGLEALRLSLAARESARTGRLVELRPHPAS